jgi:hypothetical protein
MVSRISSKGISAPLAIASSLDRMINMYFAIVGSFGFGSPLDPRIPRSSSVATDRQIAERSLCADAVRRQAGRRQDFVNTGPGGVWIA